MPMDAAAELHWRRPRAAGSVASLAALLRASALHLQPSFGLIPLAHDVLAALREAAELRLMVRSGTENESRSAAGGLGSSPTVLKKDVEFWQAVTWASLFVSGIAFGSVTGL